MQVEPVGINRAQYLYVDFMIDVFVYTAVLNLFVGYGDAIIIDSFTVSLIAALMMKVTLDLIEAVVRRIKAALGDRESAASKVLLVLAVEAVMIASKFFILYFGELIFEEDIELGGFFNVFVLVVTMMAARDLSTRCFFGLDDARLLGPSNRDHPLVVRRRITGIMCGL